MQELLSFVNQLADEAGTVIRQHFRQPFDIERKEDDTPVTVADRMVEQKLREIIERERPEDGILGEEYGPRESRNGLTWVLDPIDGTKSFMVGRPTFGTLIALCRDGVPILGAIDQPILKERWIGDGERTTFNGRPVHTRPCATIKEAVCTCTSPRQIDPLWKKFYKECKAMVWGGDCYSYGLLANGWLDICVETMLAPYDFAALSPIVQGAGGWMGDWDGKPLTLQSDGRTIALGNEALKDQFFDLLKG